ncbi:Elongation of fatty acids protein [Trichophyton interdigitale]|nr:Elongation of fatty acids protein [Trichophyton interdigitale]KAG5217137.1 Elongation of fatty acids protein [Trichophyton interdigitale]
MIRAFRLSWPDQSMRSSPAAIVDCLCKINGPRGLGNAAVYDTSANRWSMTNPDSGYHLTPEGLPDATDVGRLWNSGLAYFGFLFYLSKFYEVLDTAIILAKGKRSSTLQTYHHAGAMMCMWAGIRYMASPIWIFALFNSLIHAMMYTYYTLTALRVKVPTRIKRSLTTMQIAQFVIGTLLAAAHLFISYSVPVQESHPVALQPLTETIPSQDTTGLLPWLKKLAFRAAGADGVAANVLSANRTLFGADGSHAAHALVNHRELRKQTLQARVPCINTSGQAFAIWLNLVYLLPLTFLFVRFFIRSYLRRSNEHQHHAAEKAIKDVTREISKAVGEMHGNASDGPSSGSSTPRPERAYDANVLDLLNRKQRIAEKEITTLTPQESQPSTREQTQESQENKSTATSTAIDVATVTQEQKYEANLKDVMTAEEKAIDSHPEESTALSVDYEAASPQSPSPSPSTPMSHAQRRKKKAAKRH